MCPYRSTLIQTKILNGERLHFLDPQKSHAESMCRNDILRKHGIIPEKAPSPTPMIEEALQEARRLAHENRLEGKDLDELAELEDDEDEEFLESYRYGVCEKHSNASISHITARSARRNSQHLTPNQCTTRCIRFRKWIGHVK